MANIIIAHLYPELMDQDTGNLICLKNASNGMVMSVPS